MFRILNNLSILFISNFYLSRTLNNLDLDLFKILNKIGILFISYFNLSRTLNNVEFVFIEIRII